MDKHYFDSLTDDEKYDFLMKKAVEDRDNNTTFVDEFFKENPGTAEWVFQKRITEMIEEGL